MSIRMDFCDVFDDVTKEGRKLQTSEYLENGLHPIYDQGQNEVAGYTNETEGLFTNTPVILFGDHTRVVKYVDTPCFLGADGVKLLKPKIQNVNAKYLFYAVRSVQIPNTGYNRHFKWLKEATISIPAKEEQDKIVAILDETNHLISLRKKQLQKLDDLVKARFVEMFGDPEENPFRWGKHPLSEIIVNANNGMARRGNDPDGNIVMRLVELQDGYIDYSSPNRIIMTDTEKNRFLLFEKDFLFARVNGNPENVGRCAVFHDIGEPVYHNDHIIRVHFDDRVLDGTFASALINSAYGKRQMKSQIKTSAGQYTISQDGIGAIIAIVPPIGLQQQFAAFVSQVDKSKLSIQQGLEKLETLKKSLMQQYFG